MAYTRTWAEVLNLLGSRDSDEIDDASREAHVDFTERLSDILYDVNADPWVVRVPGVNIDGTVTHRMAAYASVLGTGTATRAPGSVHPASASGSCELIFPVNGPQGSKVRAFNITGYRTIVGASVQAELWEIDTSTGAATNLAAVSLTLIQGGIQSAASGIIDRDMLSTRAFYIRVVLVADASGAGTAGLTDVGQTVKLAGTP